MSKCTKFEVTAMTMANYSMNMASIVMHVLVSSTDRLMQMSPTTRITTITIKATLPTKASVISERSVYKIT